MSNEEVVVIDEEAALKSKRRAREYVQETSRQHEGCEAAVLATVAVMSDDSRSTSYSSCSSSSWSSGD